MVNNSYLKTEFRSNFNPGRTLPKISTNLDSVRSYQFEVRFAEVPVNLRETVGGLAPNQAGPITAGAAALSEIGVENMLTTAAKQVSPIGGTVDDIVVDRLNDKVFYPGKFTPENVTITFDNQLLSRSTPAIYNWFRTIYDPLTGDMMKNAAPGGPGNRSFKCSKMTVLELNNTNEPHAYIEMYGVYPTAVRFSEKNYATNDFSTVEVTFRFDFLNYDQDFPPS